MSINPPSRESTLVLLKPEALIRRQAGVMIIHALQQIPGAEIVEFIRMTVAREFAERHYAEHQDKPFYDKLVSQLASPIGVIMMVITGDGIVQRVRDLCGPAMVTPKGCIENPNTLRNLYGISMGLNSIHASATIEAAQAEIEMWKQRPFSAENARIDINRYYTTPICSLRTSELQTAASQLSLCAENMIAIMASESFLPVDVIRQFMGMSVGMAFK